MLEVLYNKSERSDLLKKDITFDFEGRIIQIKKPAEHALGEIFVPTKVKFKKAQVEGNFIKEAIEKAKKKNHKSGHQDEVEHRKLKEEKKAKEKVKEKKE